MKLRFQISDSGHHVYLRAYPEDLEETTPARLLEWSKGCEEALVRNGLPPTTIYGFMVQANAAGVHLFTMIRNQNNAPESLVQLGWTETESR